MSRNVSSTWILLIWWFPEMSLKTRDTKNSHRRHGHQHKESLHAVNSLRQSANISPSITTLLFYEWMIHIIVLWWIVFGFSKVSFAVELALYTYTLCLKHCSMLWLLRDMIQNYVLEDYLSIWLKHQSDLLLNAI